MSLRKDDEDSASTSERVRTSCEAPAENRLPAKPIMPSPSTALGKKVLGEGMMGFAGSLFSAGASQLVLTLSDVDAESSSSFLSDIYKNLLGPNATSLEHALTLARRSSVNSKRWSDPYYWATYVAMGSPTHSSQSAKGKS